MPLLPDSHRDLLQKKAFAALATVGKDGAPQVTPVWFDDDGRHIRFNTARGRVKDGNLRRNPAVALSIQDPDNPYRYVQVKGRVAEITEEGADAHIDALAKKYLGEDRYPHRRPGEVRVIYKVSPERVQVMGEPEAVIALDGVSKAYGGQAVLQECSWRIVRGERIGLVGPNGAGKTTLCRILGGEEEPDAGRVHVDGGVRIGYLPQEVTATGDRSVLAEALSGFADVWQLEAELERLAGLMAGPDADPSLVGRYGEAQHRFEARGGYRLESEAKIILSGLGFKPEDLHRPLGAFSGGWRMRVALARLLLLHPDLLLLDEPTNHLDLESLGWLESFLSSYDGTVVLVSHDRYFLNRMATAIAELAGGAITVYTGNYDAYLVEREARRELLEARARNQAKRVAEIERFIERFRYKASKARQVQSRVKMLDRIERFEVGPDARHIKFRFPQPPRAGRIVAELRGVHKAYGAHVVYAGVDLTVERGERVALVGLNGAGKSTLLKIAAGVLPFERGARVLGAHVETHYYAQHQLDALDPARTALEELAQADPWAATERLRTMLGSFLLSGDAAEKKVAVLSGGEKARVALAKMLLRPAAFLCLDEPTNHLDLASKEVLESALETFTGTMVFISHDRYFINRIATRVVEVEGGRLHSYLGSYDDYLDTKAGMAQAPARPDAGARADRSPPAATTSRAVLRPAPAAPDTGPDRPPAAAAPAPREAPDRAGHAPRPARNPASRALARESKAIETRLRAVEGQIQALEARLEEIGVALADPDLYRDGDRARQISQSRVDAEAEVAWLMKEWEALSERLAAAGGRGG